MFTLLPPVVQITGLTGAQGPATGRIPLSSFSNNATHVYGTEAEWNREAGSITFVLLRSARNGTRY